MSSSTSRPVGADERVPLAGVPYHAIDGYIAKLINAGYKVAIAEQVGNEPPKGEKLVPRVVRRVVTPGTLVEPGLLPEKRNNYIAALGGLALPHPCHLLRKGTVGTGRAGLAYADISTGEFAATEIADGGDLLRRVAEELGRLSPAEVLYPARDPRWAGWTTNDEGRTTNDVTQHVSRSTHADVIPSALQAYHVTPYIAWRFEETTARQTLLDHFGASSLAGFGCEDKPLAVRAAGGLLQYLQEAQKDGLAQITGLRTYSTGGVHDAGRGHPAQSGAYREHTRRHGPGLTARRARRDADTHGRTGDPPPVESTAARRNGAQSASRRADRLAR